MQELPLLTKGERTRQDIIEAAIKSVARYGFEHTTVSTIVKLAKVNRGLVVHYFSTVDKLLKEAGICVANFAIQYTTAHMATETSVTNPIDRYLKVTFDWIKERPHYGQFLVLTISRSAYDKQSEKVIQTVFTSGRERVAQMLTTVYKNKNVAKADIEATANQIHATLVGCLMNFIIDKKALEAAQASARDIASKLMGAIIR